MDKLKPCPFCGGVARILSVGFGYKVYCTNPDCEVSPQTWGELTYEAAIDAWNKRADDAPAIEPERKQGMWLPDNNSPYEIRFVCSCCKESEVVPTIGFTKYIPLWDFCPNCGAKMVTGEEE